MRDTHKKTTKKPQFELSGNHFKLVKFLDALFIQTISFIIDSACAHP